MKDGNHSTTHVHKHRGTPYTLHTCVRTAANTIRTPFDALQSYTIAATLAGTPSCSLLYPEGLYAILSTPALLFTCLYLYIISVNAPLGKLCFGFGCFYFRKEMVTLSFTVECVGKLCISLVSSIAFLIRLLLIERLRRSLS
jgi:hypothetical protein